MAKYDLTHARLDPATCLAPGLFRSLRKGERKARKLDVTYTYGANKSMRFVGFEPLGPDDLRFSQGIVALGGPKGIVLSNEPVTQTGQQLRRYLEPRFDAQNQDGLVVRESLGKLLAEVGMTDGGANMQSLKASLLRMSSVTILIREGQRQASFHMMSHAFDEEDGKLYVALNPRIAEAVLGRRPFARIDMNEVRALKAGAARLIHQRLCGWIDPGKRGRVSLKTLCEYGDPDPANAEAMKKRRQTARKALDELAELGWSVDEYAKAKWAIKRPSSP